MRCYSHDYVFYLAVLIQNRLVTDGQTNVRTAVAYRASIASRGKYRCFSEPSLCAEIAVRIIQVDTYGPRMKASQQLRTVRPHRWWQADEHLYELIDIVVQRLSSWDFHWPLCSSRRSPTKHTWSQRDNLQCTKSSTIWFWLPIQWLQSLVYMSLSLWRMKKKRKIKLYIKFWFLQYITMCIVCCLFAAFRYVIVYCSLCFNHLS